MPKVVQSCRTATIIASCALMGFTLAGCNNNATPVETKASSSSETESNSKTARKETVCPVVAVEMKKLDTELDLPGNLVALQDVPLHAKVEGYISWIGVDRGSRVKKGDRLIEITAPEVDAKVEEANARVSAADAAYRQAQAALQAMLSKHVAAKAKLDADKLTAERMAKAARIDPEAIAQNDIDVAVKSVEGDKAEVQSQESEVSAAKNLVAAELKNWEAAKSVYHSVQAMRSYLTITAPFNGVITERNVHEGSIVAVDPTRSSSPMLRIQEESVLRLVVAVPESAVSGITVGDKVPFTLPAFPGKTFYGVIARPAFALDNTTRTMPVELNYYNTDGRVEPGMFATVRWPVTRPYQTMFLPESAVATDLKGSFVIRVEGGVAERVPVAEGQSMGGLVEVTGGLRSQDQVALKATNEIKDGTRLIAKLADKNQIKSASKHSSSGGE